MSKDKTPVFFAPVKDREPIESVQAKVAALWDAARFDDLVASDDLVAIKTHFGEEGNRNYIKPPWQTPIVERIVASGGKPFWTDTNTLYVGHRSNAVDHALLAARHGFTIEATGAPVVIADGVSGREEHIVEIAGHHSKTVGIAPGVAAASTLVVVSHPTGHLACGYGGAIKNMGMGLSSRKGKLYQHSVVKPRVRESACRGDGACVRWCPTGALTVSGKAVIDPDRCIGCGECLAACRPGAIGFRWQIESELLQERMAEQAFGVFMNKRGKLGLFNFVVDVAKDCDCLSSNASDVLVRAIGVVASRDPVAIDVASLALIDERLEGGLQRHAYDIDGMAQLRHAERLGMGTASYELVPVAP